MVVVASVSICVLGSALAQDSNSAGAVGPNGFCVTACLTPLLVPKEGLTLLLVSWDPYL